MRKNRALVREVFGKWVDTVHEAQFAKSLASGSKQICFALLLEVFGAWFDAASESQIMKKRIRSMQESAIALRRRVVKPLDAIEADRKARSHIVLRRLPSGTEVWLDALVASSTFWDLHLAIRDALDVPRPPSQSVRV